MAQGTPFEPRRIPSDHDTRPTGPAAGHRLGPVERDRNAVPCAMTHPLVTVKPRWADTTCLARCRQPLHPSSRGDGRGRRNGDRIVIDLTRPDGAKDLGSLLGIQVLPL